MAAPNPQDKKSFRYLAGTLGSRGVLFVSLWWILTGGAPGSWSVGIPTVMFAVAASLMLIPPRSWQLHPRHVLAFIPYFIRRSLAGSLDVALRAVRPAMPLSPGLIHYELRLSGGEPATVFFANVISLLPGTLCAEVHATSLVVHAVDVEQPVVDHLRDLEQLIADMFGIDLGVAAAAGSEG